MGAALITSSSERWPERSADRSKREVVVLATPVWSLRAERGRLSVVLQRATLPGGAELVGLAIELPHVSLPYDFREGLERFRHHRGIADELVIRIDARVVLDWLNQAADDYFVGTGLSVRLK